MLQKSKVNYKVIANLNIKSLIITILIAYLIYVIFGIYGIPSMKFYTLESKSKEEMVFYKNKPNDTFYIKYYTIIVEGYRNYKTYNNELQRKFCSLVPENCTKYETFMVDFYHRSRFTKEYMNLNTFNRHHEEYFICRFNISNGITYSKVTLDKNNYNSSKSINISCTKDKIIK